MKNAILALFILAIGASAYQAGLLVNHSHSSAAGQGGATLNPVSITAATGSFTTLSATSFSLGSFASTSTWAANFRYSTAAVVQAVSGSGAGQVPSDNFGTCLTTITFVSNGRAVEVSFSGSSNGGIANYETRVSYLLDGTYAPGTTKDIGLAEATANGGYFLNLPFRQTVKPSAGSHTYCLTALVPAAGNNITFCPSNTVSCEFSVREIQ